MHLDVVGGVVVADTAAMAALTHRPEPAVRIVCRPHRGPAGYDVDACTAALAEHPRDPIVITAAQAAQYWGIRAGTVRQWRHVGRLQPAGTDARGHPLYPAADVVRLAADAGLLDTPRTGL